MICSVNLLCPSHGEIPWFVLRSGSCFREKSRCNSSPVKVGELLLIGFRRRMKCSRLEPCTTILLKYGFGSAAQICDRKSPFPLNCSLRLCLAIFQYKDKIDRKYQAYKLWKLSRWLSQWTCFALVMERYLDLNCVRDLVLWLVCMYSSPVTVGEPLLINFKRRVKYSWLEQYHMVQYC